MTGRWLLVSHRTEEEVHKSLWVGLIAHGGLAVVVLVTGAALALHGVAIGAGTTGPTADTLRAAADGLRSAPYQ